MFLKINFISLYKKTENSRCILSTVGEQLQIKAESLVSV